MKLRYQVRFRNVLISALLMMMGCDKYEFPRSPYSRVRTLAVTNISASGATLRAEVTSLGTTPVHNHGFIWGTVSSLKPEQSNRVSMGALGTAGAFEKELTTGLLKDSIYYVRAFVEASSHTVLGELVSFTSDGAGAPIILGIEPVAGVGGDTIRINGLGLSYQPSKTIVEFGESYYGTAIESADSSLLVIVPYGIPNPTALVAVTIANQTTVAPEPFELLYPEITSFAPAEVAIGDLVTIQGIQFHRSGNYNAVNMNGQAMEVISSSTTQLVFRLTDASGTASREVQLVVTADQRSDTADVSLLIKPPVITSISPLSGPTGTTVHITGSNFNPAVAGIQVLLGGSVATVISATTTAIDARVVSMGMVATRIAPVMVTVAGQMASSAQTFTFTDPWLRKADIPPDLNIGFAVNSKIYFVQTTSVPHEIYSYDPATNQWSTGTAITGPTAARFGSTGFVIGNKIYLGLGQSDNLVLDNSFWEYDVTTGAWQQIPDFPGNGSLEAEAFTWNDLGFVVSQAPANNMWRYEPGTTNWTPMQDFPANFDTQSGSRIDATFIIGNSVYGLTTDGSTAPEMLYRYDIMSDAWTRLNDFSTSYIPHWGAGFRTSHGGYVCFGNYDGYMYKYDQATDSWLKLSGQVFFYPGMIVTLQDRAYAQFGGGSFLGFYEYDPDYQN